MGFGGGMTMHLAAVDDYPPITTRSFVSPWQDSTRVACMGLITHNP
ncbi:MAG: hypothetical protein FWF18_05220 [Dehalococcoidia bacterium]|nr:hypothetical protein [Dehalococcoidia bacterium]